MSSSFQQKRRYLVGILVLVLIISVGLNLYNYFIFLSQMQATINNMRVEALKSWVCKMELASNILERAETNFDVGNARHHTDWAEVQVYSVLTNEIDIMKHQNKLYYWISQATSYLDEALATVLTGNQTGRVYERYLEQNVLTRIENVTTNIENIRRMSNYVLWARRPNGVEPIQQLREAGVLTDILNCLEQIYQVSKGILDYYR